MHTKVTLGSLLVFSALGCGGDDGLQGNGTLRAGTSSVESFLRLDNQSSCDVLVQPGETASVAVQLDDNLFDKLAYTVQDGTLIITETERLDPEVEDPHVIVTVPALQEVVVSNEGDVDVVGFTLDAPLRLIVTGAGDLDFSGSAPWVGVDSRGSGDVDLDGRADVLELSMTGTGQIDTDDFVTGEMRRN